MTAYPATRTVAAGPRSSGERHRPHDAAHHGRRRPLPLRTRARSCGRPGRSPAAAFTPVLVAIIREGLREVDGGRREGRAGARRRAQRAPEARLPERRRGVDRRPGRRRGPDGARPAAGRDRLPRHGSADRAAGAWRSSPACSGFLVAAVVLHGARARRRRARPRGGGRGTTLFGGQQREQPRRRRRRRPRRPRRRRPSRRRRGETVTVPPQTVTTPPPTVTTPARSDDDAAPTTDRAAAGRRAAAAPRFRSAADRPLGARRRLDCDGTPTRGRHGFDVVDFVTVVASRGARRPRKTPGKPYVRRHTHEFALA